MYQVNVAPVPVIPFAVIVVVADEQIGLAAGVADVILTSKFTVTVTLTQFGLYNEQSVSYVRA